nr:uncharacterized protein LOC111997538 [Quercus suber]
MDKLFRWKEEILDYYLLDFEADSIEAIPLCRTQQQETLMWPHNPSSEYKVKSGYKFLQDEHQHQQAGSLNPEAVKHIWQAIWKLNLPANVKNLAWRACWDSLPSKTNLVKRKQTATLRELHRHMAFIFTEDRNPTLFSMTVWALWNRRNNLRLGNSTISLSQLLDQAKDRLLEFFQHLNPAPPSTVRTDSCWRTPDSSRFKINFDGALFSQEKRAGICVVIRNEAGLVMAPPHKANSFVFNCSRGRDPSGTRISGTSN